MEFSFEELQMEIAEKTADLEAFTKARDIIRARVLEVSESQSRLTPLPHWSGTDAVLGTLDLTIHSMERTIAELHQLLKTTQPRLRLVKEKIDVN